MLNQKEKKILVAMSGGVDSSVAAALLQEQGYQVIGITMQLHPSQKAFGGCCSLESINDAKNVAAALKIPHYTLNFRDKFKEKVVENFIAEYKNGRTPNPCIRCNEHIKFDHLLTKADELGCEYIATGHYARIKSEILNSKSETNDKFKIQIFKLLKGKDQKKDQAYVLYMLNQKVLARTLFPLGEWTKDKVREKAKELSLPVHDKEESQEICFVPDDNYVNFLKENCPEIVRPGNIVDMKGKIVGKHEGIAFYTIGQRKGIGHHRGLPKYVVRLEPKTNTVVIGDKDDLFSKELIAKEVCYVSGQAPLEPLELMVKIRYNSAEVEATLDPLGKAKGKGIGEEKGNDKVKVLFKEPQRSVTPGQAVVFYHGEEVIGGGTIS